MKKIKPKLKKTKIIGLPHIGLFLHIDQQYTLAKLTVDWYLELKEKLADEIELTIFASSTLDRELTNFFQDKKVKQVIVPNGLTRGKRLNEGLKQLKEQDVDAVIPVSAGEFLTKELLISYGNHLRGGGLFYGLLDQYIYDPTSMKCVHWARGEFAQNEQRACELGLLFSKNLLNELKWQLWPSTSDRRLDALHTGVMERLSKLFSYAPSKSCLLTSMNAAGGQAFSVKSDVSRVLFDEGNWQRLSGLSFADFELTFTSSLGDEWVERLEDFDERIQLDILIEMPGNDADHRGLWYELYNFLPFKFDPYARVQLKVICREDDVEMVEGWGGDWAAVVVPDGPQYERWNHAFDQVAAGGSDAILIGGVGSLIDLKTIEHYLIHIYKHGARYLALSNFFVTFAEEHQGYFWPGIPNLSFSEVFGLGSCIHKSYFEYIGKSPFGEKGGMSEEATKRFDELCAEEGTRQQRVMFQLVRHKLGVIAFDPEGALGFTERIRLPDLQPVRLTEHIDGASYVTNVRQKLSSWELGEATGEWGEELSSPEGSDEVESMTQPLIGENPMTQTKPDGDLSPLERAKALLGGRTKQETPAQTDQSEEAASPLERAKALLKGSSGKSAEAGEAAPAPAAELSPLERAKALLKGNSGKSAEAVTSAPAPAAELSPLERAKALLKGSSSESVEAVETAPAPAAELSPLERAKALLKGSAGESAEAVPTAPAPAAELSPLERAKALLRDPELPAPKPETAQNTIAEAVQGAEALVLHLQEQLEAAKNQVSDARDEVGAIAEQAGVDSPADLLCIQGEEAFVSEDTPRANTLFESALMVDPTCIRALNNLGVLALHNDDPWRALSHFLMGVIQDPGNEDLIVNLQGLFDLHPEMKAARAVVFE